MPEIIEPIGVPEILCDGAGEIKIVEGVARIPLIAHRAGEHEMVARLAIPVSELPDFIQSAVIALTNAARVIVRPVLS